MPQRRQSRCPMGVAIPFERFLSPWPAQLVQAFQDLVPGRDELVPSPSHSF